jgi:hypothetical protein
MHFGHKVLMDVDNNGALLVGNSQGILGQWLRPHLIQLLKIVIDTLVTY